MPGTNRMRDNGGNRDSDQPRDETAREEFLTADITHDGETEAEGIVLVTDGQRAVFELHDGTAVAFDETELRRALGEAA